MSGTYYHYCGVCGTRLGSADFVSGRAVRIGHEIRCRECVTRAPAKRRPANTTRRTVVSS